MVFNRLTKVAGRQVVATPEIIGSLRSTYTRVACMLALEALLQQHEAGAAGRGLEAHRDVGFVAARAVLVFPGPGEGEAARRLDDPAD